MKKIGTALALVLLLSACEPSPGIRAWDESLNPWMSAAGWSLQRFENENYYVVRKNGVDVWREPIYCSRGCFGNFLLPDDLYYGAVTEFNADLEAAKTAYIEKISTQTGIQPIERPVEE